MTPERAAAIDAALALCDAVESLHHPKHASHIKPITDRAQKVLADYFQHQKRALVHWVKYRISEADGARRANEILPDSLSPLTFAVTTQEQQDFQAALSDAITRGSAQLAEELRSGAAIPNSALDDYLRQHSLSKLTGDFEETTASRLRNAIADAVDSGATADAIVETIEETMDGFSNSRAEMIAQTEVNSAYNFGRNEIAKAYGMSEKAWVTESDNPCPECLDNEGAGWIPMDEPFPTGDMMPTAHPRCFCSLDFRVVSTAE